jgi:phospholipid/cholesterol/gamma-HCH transport system permease protein
MGPVVPGWQQRLFDCGSQVLALLHHVGAMAGMAKNLILALRRHRLDIDEFRRALYLFGNASLPLTLITATFMGLTLVLQSAFYVQQFGAQDLIGWFAAYSVMRELGPVVLGLMLSGRVGANNTAELATLQATERLAALQGLGVDLYAWLLLPRAVAMVLAHLVLLMVANAVALTAGALGAKLLLHVQFMTFYRSIVARLGVFDLGLGLGKAAVFGLVVALVSSYFGCAHRGGVAEVGHAVRQQVVACALCLFAVDYMLSVLTVGMA